MQFFFQVMISQQYAPLLHFLPFSLSDRAYVETPGLGSDDPANDEDVDENASNGQHAGLIADETRGEKGTNGYNADVEAEAVPDVSTKVRQYAAVDYGFAQPAASRPQPIIWLPTDTLGIGAEEEGVNNEQGILTSREGAQMNEKGLVDVENPPPGENA